MRSDAKRSEQLRCHRFVYLLLAVSLTRCECITHKFDPISVRVPRGAATPLATAGLPLGALDEFVLKAVDPADAGSQIRLWMEFERAPSMMMVHVAPVVASNLDTFVSPFVDPKDTVPPLEVDNVFCGSESDGGFRPPLSISDGTWEMEEFCLSTEGRCPDPGARPPFSRSYIKIERVAATVSRVRLSQVPTASGTPEFRDDRMKLELTLQNLQASVRERIVDAAGTQWYPPPGDVGSHGISLNSLTVECEIWSPRVVTVGGCGEVQISCSEENFGPQVTLSGLSGMLMGLNLPDFAGVIQDEIWTRLVAGLQLHFEGFSASAPLRITAGSPTPLLAKLTGTFTNSCSHVPAPPPSTPAPIRGIARVRPHFGAGEHVQGDYVMPFRLRPEVKFDWTDKDETASVHGEFLTWTTPSAFRVFGSELSKLLSDGTYVRRDLEKLRLEGQVELVQEEIDTCWQKAEKTLEVFEPLQIGFGECERCLGEQAFLSVSYDGNDNLFTREVDALSGAYSLAIAGKTEVEFEAVAKVLRGELGDEICPGPNCPDLCPEGVCESWTRYDLVPSGFPDPADRIPPMHFELWVDHRLPVPDSFHYFDPRECQLPPPADVGPDRRIVEPAVTLARFQMDSAEFESNELLVPFYDNAGGRYATGLDPTEEKVRGGAGGDAAKRFPVWDSEGPQSIRITLTNDCPAHGASDPHLKDSLGAAEPCWRGKFIPSQPGTVTVTQAFSNVTATRFALDDTVFGPGGSENNSAQLGWQNLAVTGTLDRSGLRFYTSVPQIYRDLGVTNALRDYRETSVDDHNHNPWTTAMYFDWQHGGTFPSPDILENHLRLANHERWTTDDNNRGHRFRYFADWNRDLTTAEWVSDDPPSFCVAPEKLFVNARKMSFKGAGLENEKVLDANLILTSGPGGPTGPQISLGGSASGSFWSVLH